MDVAQGYVTTLHDLGSYVPEAPISQSAVVIPMTEREYATHATEVMLAELEAMKPGQVIIALRVSPARLESFNHWLMEFELPITVIWCSSKSVQDRLEAHDLDGAAGKGRDVWLALGIAAMNHRYVVCHDADTQSYSGRDIARLLSPVDHGFEFTKGYYARVEGSRLYGRLFRLLFVPLVAALTEQQHAPVLRYLQSYRYALAGEFAASARLIRNLRVERRFGLEVGTLGDVYGNVGIDEIAQVDLGWYEHDHRAVGGPTGLAEMSEDVAAALLRVVEDHGVTPEYDVLSDSYREMATRFIHQYKTDARINGLDYSEVDEWNQVTRYSEVIIPPGPDDRLPAWSECSLDPNVILDASQSDIDEFVG